MHFLNILWLSISNHFQLFMDILDDLPRLFLSLRKQFAIIIVDFIFIYFLLLPLLSFK